MGHTKYTNETFLRVVDITRAGGKESKTRGAFLEAHSGSFLRVVSV